MLETINLIDYANKKLKVLDRELDTLLIEEAKGEDVLNDIFRVSHDIESITQLMTLVREDINNMMGV